MITMKAPGKMEHSIGFGLITDCVRVLRFGFFILLLSSNVCFAQWAEDEVHGNQNVTGNTAVGEISSASGILGNLHISLPYVASATHEPWIQIGTRIMAASDVVNPTPSINWYTSKLINGATVWVMDSDSIISMLEDAYAITISSASCGVIAVHPALPDYLSINKVIHVDLCGAQIPAEQCLPYSTINSATRNDAIRIYQRFNWFTPPSSTGKSRGIAHVEITYVTP